MNIQYTYEIIKVDTDARNMEVVYASEGRQTMHIGARLPYEGESLESVIQMYAPIGYWLEQSTPVVAPNVGAAGSVVVTEPEPVIPSYDQFRKLAYQNESDPIFFKWQRGEATQQEWLDKVEEIKARFIGDMPVTEV